MLPARVRARREFGQQSRLADARLADQQERGRTAQFEIGQDLVERAHLVGAPNEALGVNGHGPPPAQDRSGSRRDKDQGAALMSGRPDSDKLGS